MGAVAEGQRSGVGSWDQAEPKLLLPKSNGGNASGVSFLGNLYICLSSQVPGLSLRGPWDYGTGALVLAEQPAV